MYGTHRRFICDVAKDINCDIDDILRIAANDNQLKRPPFFLWACLTGGWAHYLNLEGEPMPNRTQMTVGGNWSLLMPYEIGLLRRKGAISLTKLIQSTDEIAPDDWSRWKLEPPQEITSKDVAIEVADIETLRTLLAEAAPAPKIDAAPTAMENARTSMAIPGKMPNVTIGKLAIKAAWQIECETSKRATASAVINRLQEWVASDDYPELLETIAHGVTWATKKGKPNNYDNGACEKTLETWNRSRL